MVVITMVEVFPGTSVPAITRLWARHNLSARGLGPVGDTLDIRQPEADAVEPVPDVVALHAVVVRQLDAEVFPSEAKLATGARTTTKTRAIIRTAARRKVTNK